ncbi:hypothetical protein HLB23_19615 [Nocardia uniformis]|uniref:ESX-1 secretion-associated protein n=1 Tax=Nocardia uniformis TaxID=53432 RepID=A0A849C2S9_9NOCA|nr:type VII secretion target [Nocardia uniformis]NNH72038.1 hypothetical protein [Nocardia uniformis]
MHRLTVDPDGLLTHAATTQLLATDLATAATHGAAASPHLLTPLLGLIGTDFVAAYTAAHAGHIATVGTLSAVLTSMSTTSTGAASLYAATDTARANTLRATAAELGA